MIWINTIIALVGTILNIKKRRICFMIWLVSNSGFMVHNYLIGQYAQSLLFAVYVGLSIWGLWEWRSSRGKDGDQV